MNSPINPAQPPPEQTPPPPSKAAAEPPVRSVPGDRAVTALVYAIYSTMVVFMGLSLFLAVKFILPSPPTPTPAACREDLANSCDEGMYCRDGACIPVPNEACKEGDACTDACSCLAPSSCGADQICRAPAPTIPVVCTESMMSFVQELVDHQKNCEAVAGAPLSSCAPQNVQNFLLAHERFDVLLKDFGSSFVFMFPNGRPTLVDGERAEDVWKDPNTESRYLEVVKAQEDALRKARYIIIVGRATRSKAAVDYAYAQARVRFARERLLEALGGKDRVNDVSAKFIEFALGSDRPLQLDFYRSYLRVSTAWWNDHASRELTAALNKLEGNISLPAKERAEAEKVINRSVAVFAIPPECVREQR